MSKMNKMLLASAVAISGVAAMSSSSQAAIIFNEVYPGGGSSSSTAAYQKDFVELYNTSALPVDLTGYQVLYASSSGAFTNNIFSFGAGSVIGANDYLLIFTGTAGTGGAATPALINATGNASLSASSGSVEVTDGTNVLDLVGWGTPTGTGKFETAAVAAPANIGLSLSRTNFVDTNNNSADFTSGTPSPTYGATSTAVAAATPEPASLGVLAMGGLALLARRRK